MSTRNWTPSSWQAFPAVQQPKWPDNAQLDSALQQIASFPPLVFAGEARSLQAALGQVASGNAFLLQAGDCAESFEEFTAVNIREKLRVILQMAVMLTYSMGVPVVKVGRIAGQFAKPRSNDTEMVDGTELPVFRGHMVNDPSALLDARVPNPQRLVQAYHQAASTLNLVRAFTKGGFADLNRVHSWNQEFVATSAEANTTSEVVCRLAHVARFLEGASSATSRFETSPEEALVIANTRGFACDSRTAVGSLCVCVCVRVRVCVCVCVCARACVRACSP
jgi:3-deoxy-7-phosphoheptulonate synthase